MGKTVRAVVGVALAIGIAIAAPYLAPLALGFLSITATATAIAIATAVIGIGLSIGASMLMRAISPKRNAESAQSQTQPMIIRQSLTDSLILYGRRRVIYLKWVFFHGKRSGATHLRYFVFAIAGHRIAGNPEWMLNDQAVTVDGSGMVTSGTYANKVWLWLDRGEDDATAHATFVSECDGKWTTEHRGRGIAKIFMKAEMSDPVVQAGFCTPAPIIEGKDDIYDPRDESEGYTDNATLVTYDWMKLAREDGGFGAYADEIPDDDLLAAWANVCDEEVEGEARYALDGVIVTGAAPSEVRDQLVINQAGTYTFSEGKHLARPGYWVPPSETLLEKDLAGPIQASAFLSGDISANEVQSSFIDPESKWQPMPAAMQTSDPAPTDIRQMDLDLPWIISKYRGERISRIMLNRAQCEKTVVWPANIAALKVRAMDTVQCDTARHGLSNYAFTVNGWQLSSDFGIVLTLREENEDIYADPEPVEVDDVPDIQPGDPVLTTSAISNAIRGSYPVGLAIATTNTAGVGSITIGDHERDYPGDAAPVPITGATIGSLTPDTTYYPYYDDASMSDETPTFAVTTVYADALNSSDHPYRHYLYQEATIPASPGSGSGTGSGGGYGGGGGPIP